MDVKQRIKTLLKQHDMTIYKLANEANLSSACINNWYGKRDYEPSLNALLKISDALDIPIAQLLYDGEDMLPADELLMDFYDSWIVLNWEQRQALADIAKAMVVDKDVK
ncbi:MAG: helix-turn-helix transcriptional regulator [Clostridia bacterium]|nr:helix-turn-helix transcriptional regulator [Clostridia bacterium]